jgi:MSHA pilin protein MshA
MYSRDARGSFRRIPLKEVLIMKRMQTGFTMIELIVVIVILGVLAATALPKFVNIQSDAETAALSGVAGSMASAMSVNYGGCLVTNHGTAGGDAQKCRVVNTCDDVAGLLQGDALPTDYAVGLKTGETASTTNGATYICEVWHTDRTSTKKEYQAISAGN